MDLLYKVDDLYFKDTILNDDNSDNNNTGDTFLDNQNPIENNRETDQALLDIGIQSFCNSIINEDENVEYSVNQLAKFCLCEDFYNTFLLFDPAFIASIIKLINYENSLDFSLIMLFRNIWCQPIKEIEIVYSDELISSFCKYLYAPLEFRDYVYESFKFLLNNIPENTNQQIIDTLLNFNVFESLNEYFEFIISVDSSLIEPKRFHEMTKHSILFIHSLACNPCLSPEFLINIIKYAILILSNDNFISFKSFCILLLYHIIIELGQVEMFISDLNNVQVLINNHVFNDTKIFSNLYEIDSKIWQNEECKRTFLNDSLFFNNIASLLIDQHFSDYLRPIFIFLNNTMNDIWLFLYTTFIEVEPQNSQRLIYVILDHSNNNSSLRNKIIAGLCISSFLQVASISEKKEVAFNGGFEALSLLISTAESLFLRKMLKCIKMLLLDIPELFENQANINDIKQTLSNMDATEGDDETFAICIEVLQIIQSYEENM